MKRTLERLRNSKDVVSVSILLTIALCLGIYLIVTTALVAKDSTSFIKYAKRLEADPVKTMVGEYQHPGYPFLILAAHKVTHSLHEDTSILSWIYCGQSVALLFRLGALTILYFIGKHLCGAKASFWAILILILLPNPAKYGSDGLSDWPHLFFLVAGLWLLLRGTRNKRPWIFGFAGVAAGFGYLVRPECAQVIVLGSLWLGLQLLLSKRSMSKGKALPSLALLCVGFLIIAGPYMKLKGAVFPKKQVGQFAQSVHKQEDCEYNSQGLPEAKHSLQVASFFRAKAFIALAGNIGETLMWFFLPALLIGMSTWLKKREWHEPEKFFVIAPVVLNVPVMIWLYCKYGYMSDRHTLPLMIIPILFVPVGLQELAIRFELLFSKQSGPSILADRGERFWFLTLVLIGFCVCAPKLFRPIRLDKQGYRAAAQWLEANTDSAHIIAVPDNRITFYAEREGVIYKNGHIPTNTVYTVRILKNQKDETDLMGPSAKVEFKYVSNRRRGYSVIIQRNL